MSPSGPPEDSPGPWFCSVTSTSRSRCASPASTPPSVSTPRPPEAAMCGSAAPTLSKKVGDERLRGGSRPTLEPTQDPPRATGRLQELEARRSLDQRLGRVDRTVLGRGRPLDSGSGRANLERIPQAPRRGKRSAALVSTTAPQDASGVRPAGHSRAAKTLGPSTKSTPTSPSQTRQGCRALRRKNPRARHPARQGAPTVHDRLELDLPPSGGERRDRRT